MDYNKIGRFFFPVHCPICDRAQPEGQRICPECAGIPRIVKPPRCLKCSKHINTPGEIYCYDCLRNPGEYDRGFSLFEYQSIHDSISAFKNLGRPEYGEYYGRILGEHYREEIRKIKPDALLPIPLLGRLERRNNMKKAFHIAENDVKLKTVILVDDIYTTGSTIGAAAAVLKTVGVETIYFITLATGRGY